MGFVWCYSWRALCPLEKEILEAAAIDGANFWQKHFYVTLPQMSGVIEFFIVVELIHMLSWVFAYIFTMTGGGGLRLHGDGNSTSGNMLLPSVRPGSLPPWQWSFYW